MTPEQPTGQSDDELRHYLYVVRRRKWSIMFCAIVALGAALYVTSKQTPLYRSHSEVLVRPIGTGAYPYIVLGQVQLGTEAGIARSYPVAEIAAEELDANEPPGSLLGGLSVSTAGQDTDILAMDYVHPEPETAQVRAQAFADAYLKYRKTQASEEAEAQAADIQKQLQDVNRKLLALQVKLRNTKNPAQQQALITEQAGLAARQSVLQQNKQSVLSRSAISGGGGDIVAPAELPRAPFSPAPARNAVLALVLGSLLGLGLAFGRERLDNRLRGRRDFETLLKAPVLATIPQVKGWRRGASPQLVTLADPLDPSAEAYRSLRTNVQYLWKEQGVGAITIVSAKMGDGKTTTAANLAVTLAQAGRKVIVVSCDLRKPRLHAFFDLPNDVGVTSLLTGERGLLDVVQRTSVDNLRLVASGPVPPNPAELLGSDAMDEMVSTLRPMADFVIFDTPPVLAVADALILGPKTDGVIVVADASSGVRDEVSHVREEIEQVGGRVLGGVFNSFDPEHALYYSPQYRKRYGYSYTALYGQPSADQPKEGSPAANGSRKSRRAAKRDSL